MSRAFISEADSDFDEADVPQLKIPLPPGSKNYMTAEGAQKIESELYWLLHEERPKLAAGLSRQVAGSDSTDRETQSQPVSLERIFSDFERQSAMGSPRNG